MTKVITYGTFDLLHHGHIRLLERAKELGDYLIVGVTADDFDRSRGKINVSQTLMERIEAVRATGIADEIIVEEYEGQKIDDIQKYHVDIFTVGSDWVGKFDYLNEYCRVVYLERTRGISSTELRAEKSTLRLGLVGSSRFLNKVAAESVFANGVSLTALCTDNISILSEELRDIDLITSDYAELLEHVDAVYLRSRPYLHAEQIRMALERGVHVLCESPVTLSTAELDELQALAESRGLVLMEAIKTAYSTAYERLLVLLKTGIIGDIVCVDAACTSLRKDLHYTDWHGIYEWGPTALLPILQTLGTDYRSHHNTTSFRDAEQTNDRFTKLDFVYDHAVACARIGDGVKAEGELVISGTRGYVYVPAPWWKTDYFEVRYENPNENRRYFYQLDGEGIRHELIAFSRCIAGEDRARIDRSVTRQITSIMEKYVTRQEFTAI